MLNEFTTEILSEQVHVLQIYILSNFSKGLDSACWHAVNVSVPKPRQLFNQKHLLIKQSHNALQKCLNH